MSNLPQLFGSNRVERNLADNSTSEVQAAVAFHEPLAALFGEYKKLRAEIERIASYVAGASIAVSFFLSGAQKEKHVGSLTACKLFEPGPAIRALDAEFWSRAMELTDVLDLMPADQRNGWTRQIKAHETPPFEPDNVRTTLQVMLDSRAQFFADRIQGLFYNLSGRHATNSPDGFYKRMIISGMRTYFGSFCYERSYFIHDLRCVIAMFFGRGEPLAIMTTRSLEAIYHSGEFGVWHDFDGGAFRLRLYKVGTCHLEVHRDVAQRLNMVLAWKNPGAIPSKFRKGAASAVESQPVCRDLIPFDVLAEVDGGFFSSEGKRIFFNSAISVSAADFLRRCQGRFDGKCSWDFDYDFSRAIRSADRTGQFTGC